MMKTVHLLTFCCLLLMSLFVPTIASPTSGTVGVGASSSTISGPSAPGAGTTVKPAHISLQSTRPNQARFPHRKTFTSLSLIKSGGRPYGGAITAQARRRGGSDGNSGDNNGYFDYFSRKSRIIKEFLVKKAKKLTTARINPEQIDAGILEVLMSMVALHVRHKIIYQGIMYSNKGMLTKREDFEQNYRMQLDTLTPLNLRTLGPKDIQLIGAILGEWVIAKRPPKVVFTDQDGEEEPNATIVLDHDLAEDFWKLFESTEMIGQQLAQDMDNEIDRLASKGFNSKLETIDEDENYVPGQKHPYPIFQAGNKHKFDLGIFEWTFMAFGEKQVMDAIRLILLLRMLLDGQLTGQGLLDYLEQKCVPVFRDNQKRDKYILVLQMLARRMGWFNHYDDAFPDGLKNIFVYRHRITWKHGEQLKNCERFGDISTKN